MADFSVAASPGTLITTKLTVDRRVTDCVSVYSLVDIFPVLLRLPQWMHWWEKSAAVMRERQNAIWLKYWNGMKDKIDKGIAPECFGRQLVEAGYSQKGIDELQAAFVAGSKSSISNDMCFNLVDVD